MLCFQPAAGDKKICGPSSRYGMRFQFEFPFVKSCCLFQPDACKKILNRIFSSSSGLHRTVLRFLNQYSGLQLNFSLANNRPSAGLLLRRMAQISKSLLRPSAEICYSDEISPLTPRNYTPDFLPRPPVKKKHYLT